MTNIQEAFADLLALKDPQQRLARIVEMGRAAGPLPDECKTDSQLVPGCLSRLWLVCECKDGRCRFRCDSDSAVVKGIASLICCFYSDMTPSEVLAHEPDFLSRMGINQHLSANRRNGLTKVRSLIATFARDQLGENVPYSESASPSVS